MGLYRAKEVWTGTLASSIPDGTVTSFTLTSSSGLTNGETYVFTIDRVDANGTKTPSKKEAIVGTVSGSNVINCQRGAEGTAQAHSAGAIVEILFTAKHWNDLIDNYKTQHNSDGTHSKIQGLDNNQAITQKDNTGTARDILKLDSSNNLIIGGTGINKAIFYVPFDGWIAANETWTYASATSFTVSGDVTGKYQKGDKIKLTQSSTVKYFYITNVSYSAPNTTITITGGSDYSLDNATITNNYYSKAENPQGFPAYFNYTPTWTANTGTQPNIGNGTIEGKFKINGNLVYCHIFIGMGSTTTYGSGGNVYIVSLPVTPLFTTENLLNAKYMDSSPWQAYSGVVQSNGWLIATHPGFYVYYNAPFTWASGDYMHISGTYLF